jgi:hypothetical protein
MNLTHSLGWSRFSETGCLPRPGLGHIPIMRFSDLEKCIERTSELVAYNRGKCPSPIYLPQLFLIAWTNGARDENRTLFVGISGTHRSVRHALLS